MQLEEAERLPQVRSREEDQAPAGHPEASNPPQEEQRRLKGHEGAVLAVRFNRSGTYCLSCGKDRTIRLWNPHKGVQVKAYHGHGYDVRDVAVAADNSKFVSCGGDRQLFLWDVGSGKTIRKLAGHNGVVNAVCYGPGDETVVSSGYDQAVSVWDLRSRSFEAIQTMKPFADSVTSVRITPRLDILAGSVDGTLRRFDLRAGCVYSDQLGAPVTHVALTQDGQCALAACLGGPARLVDLESGQLLAQYAGHVHQTTKQECAVTPTDTHVLCGSEDGRVVYWDLVEETQAASFQAAAGPVCALALHPQGTCLLTAATDGSFTVWA